jgi:hypothetical protein
MIGTLQLFYDQLNALFIFTPLRQASLSSRVIYLSNHLTDFVKLGTGNMNYKLSRELKFSPSPPTNAYIPVMLKSYIIKFLERLIIGQELLGYEVKAFGFISLTDHYGQKRRPGDHRLSISFSCMSQNISLRSHSTGLFLMYVPEHFITKPFYPSLSHVCPRTFHYEAILPVSFSCMSQNSSLRSHSTRLFRMTNLHSSI